MINVKFPIKVKDLAKVVDQANINTNTMIGKIEKILIERDGLSIADASDMVKSMRMKVWFGADPEDVLMVEVGLEPDYVLELI